MTEKELEMLLHEKCDVPNGTNISMVLSPQIVRTAAHLKKRRQDRIQTLLCVLSAAGFLLAGVLLFFFSEDLAEFLKNVGIIAGIGMLLTLLCAPVLVWHEENQ